MVTSQLPVYLDEDVPITLSDRLRDLGIVATLARDALPGREDTAQLKQCADNRLILVTHNRRDFQRLHWLWTAMYSWNILDSHHGGILTTYNQPALPDEWAPAIAKIITDEADELPGTMWMWRNSTQKWEPLPLKFP